MAVEVEAPRWARFVTDPPIVTSYAGPEDEAVMWHGSMSRKRLQINVGGSFLTVNVAQAALLAAMLVGEAL